MLQRLAAWVAIAQAISSMAPLPFVAAASSSEAPTPLELVTVPDATLELTLNRRTLTQLSKLGDRPLHVVTAAGRYRSGKSFLLKELTGSNVNFEVGHGLDGVTKGIFGQLTEEDGHSVLWLDTEGLFEGGKQDKYGKKLFAFAMLCSSTMMLVSKQEFDEPIFKYFHEQSKIRAYLSDYLNITHELPHLFWLLNKVSAWNLGKVSKHWDRFVKQLDNPGNNPALQEGNSMRKLIQDSYDNTVLGLGLACGGAECGPAETQPSLAESFHDAVGRLRQDVKKKLFDDQTQSRAFTAKALVKWMETLVLFMNGRDIELEALRHVWLSRNVPLVVAKYEATLGLAEMPFNEEAWSQRHRNAKDAAIGEALTSEGKLRDVKTVLQASLDDYIEKLWLNRTSKNLEKLVDHTLKRIRRECKGLCLIGNCRNHIFKDVRQQYSSSLAKKVQTDKSFMSQLGSQRTDWLENDKCNVSLLRMAIKLGLALLYPLLIVYFVNRRVTTSEHRQYFIIVACLTLWPIALTAIVRLLDISMSRVLITGPVLWLEDLVPRFASALFGATPTYTLYVCSVLTALAGVLFLPSWRCLPAAEGIIGCLGMTYSLELAMKAVLDMEMLLSELGADYKLDPKDKAINYPQNGRRRAAIECLRHAGQLLSDQFCWDKPNGEALEEIRRARHHAYCYVLGEENLDNHREKFGNLWKALVGKEDSSLQNKEFLPDTATPEEKTLKYPQAILKTLAKRYINHNRVPTRRSSMVELPKDLRRDMDKEWRDGCEKINRDWTVVQKDEWANVLNLTLGS